MTDEGDGQQQRERADEIIARVGGADPAELERWAQDDRVTVQAAARAELQHRLDEPNTGRPPANEVSQQLYEQAYGTGEPYVHNADPEVLAAPQTHGVAPVAAASEGVDADAAEAGAASEETDEGGAA